MSEAGFSTTFLRAVVTEIETVERRIDKLDRRIEQAKRQSTKDALTEERRREVGYEAFLRRLMR